VRRRRVLTASILHLATSGKRETASGPLRLEDV
jgi:hypothetical protein